MHQPEPDATCYHNMEPIIDQLVKSCWHNNRSILQRYGYCIDDVYSNAHLRFVLCWQKFDGTIGEFHRYFRFALSRYLKDLPRDLCRKNEKCGRVPYDEERAGDTIAAPDTSDFLDELTGDAKELAMVCLHCFDRSNRDTSWVRLAACNRGATRRTRKAAVISYCLKNGWNRKRLAHAIQELTGRVPVQDQDHSATVVSKEWRSPTGEVGLSWASCG